MSSTGPDAGIVTLVDGFVPVIDLGLASRGTAARRRALASAIGRACETSGFLVVTNHGIAARETAAIDHATREFFAEPPAVKELLAADPKDALMRGYGAEGGARGPNPPHRGAADRRDGRAGRAAGGDPARQGAAAPAIRVEVGHLETFVMNRLGERELAGPVPDGADPSLYAPNRWPDLPGFRDAYLAYFAAGERLALDIMALFALALDLPEDWFEPKFDQHMTSLAANFYPAATEPASHALRKGEHTDWGTLTILHKDSSAAGLEVLDRSGHWREVPAVAGSLVINLGDLMAMWTNDRWASTIHRVVYPAGSRALAERYSVAFFHQPSRDALIECIPSCTGPGNPPRHRPVRFGDYLSGKARRAYLHRHLGRSPSGQDRS
jgi:isopenicillin N synthase-like dioxygenase